MAAAETGKKKEKIKLVAAVAIFLAAGGVAWYMLGGETAADTAAQRVFICAETGKSFEHTIDVGEIEPIYSPFTKRNTAYQAEACYWVKGDGEDDWKAKSKPDYVLWKKRVDPETEEKTVCPVCGHEVVGHNPMPSPELMAAAKAEGR